MIIHSIIKNTEISICLCQKNNPKIHFLEQINEPVTLHIEISTT